MSSTAAAPPPTHHALLALPARLRLLCRDQPALPPSDAELNAGSTWLLGVIRELAGLMLMLMLMQPALV